MRIFSKSELGQSLIEAVIALGAAAIIVSAIAVAVVTSVNNSDFSKYQNLATQYAQQGIEILKERSESSWQNFSTLSGTYCLSQSSSTLAPALGGTCTTNINNFFVRKVVITQNSGSCSGNAKVTVNVSWSDGKCTSSSNIYCHSVELNSCLADINSATTP